MLKRIYILLPLVIALFTSCDRPLPAGLIILDGASGQKHFYTGGIYRVLYQLQEKFPAENKISAVTQKLESAGWKPLQKEFLHPNIETSLVTGWTFYEDPPKRPEWIIYEWSGNWKDQKNNVVTYAFQYKDPIGKYKQSTVIMKPSSSTLIVHAVYMPEKVALNMRDSINRKKTK